MMKFVIPSGVILTIGSGLVGFVVSGLARIEASGEGKKIALEASETALKAAEISGEARANAAKAANDAKTAEDRAQAAASSADDASKYLSSVKDRVDKVLAGQYEGLATSLFGIKEFRDSIQTIPQREIAEFNYKFAQIEKALSTIRPTVYRISPDGYSEPTINSRDEDYFEFKSSADDVKRHGPNDYWLFDQIKGSEQFDFCAITGQIQVGGGATACDLKRNKDRKWSLRLTAYTVCRVACLKIGGDEPPKGASANR
jgi:hypothetical protein